MADSIDIEKRLNNKEIFDELSFLGNTEYIEKFINALPYMGAILTDTRQVVFANEKLLNTVGLKTLESGLGQRPGELLNCVNATKGSGGCGTSSNCQVCGAYNCIVQSQKNKIKTEMECRILADSDGDPIAYDFKVTSNPLIWKGKAYTIFSLVDIGDEKRRMAMEKIFFHDVLNKTGSMHGFLDLLKSEGDVTRIHEFINYIDSINKDLISEIVAQRELSAAENNELITNPISCESIEIITTAKNQMEFHEVSKNKTILINEKAESFTLVADSTLLRRILMNMVKNALEASENGEIVSINCKQNNAMCSFSVHNNSVMPNEVQMQVFQRSYSTKSVNRGLGTYSMKLLGEKYLKGKVDFISNKEGGTTFFIELPMK